MWLSWISHTYLVPSESTTPGNELKSEREHLNARPLGPLGKRVCHARAASEAQGEPREVFELVGIATVVVPSLGPPPIRPR